MAKIAVLTFSRKRGDYTETKHYVEVQIDGVGFETECQTQEKALDLALKTANALGIKYKAC